MFSTTNEFSPLNPGLSQRPEIGQRDIPRVLEPSVLEEIQRDLIALPGVGMSILEISHRSAAFEKIESASAKRPRLDFWRASLMRASARLIGASPALLTAAKNSAASA